MEKILDLFLLIVLAFGSAILFSFAIIWKLVQAVFQYVAGSFRKVEA